MPIRFEDGISDNLVNGSQLSNINSVQLGTAIKGMTVITADEAEFKSIKIDGDLELRGKLHADQIKMTETQIVLNLDYDKITEYMANIDSPDLEFFIRHLHKLKLMAEKELLDRS